MIFKKFTFKKVLSTNITAINIIKRKNFKNGMVISETQKKEKVNMEENGFLIMEIYF